MNADIDISGVSLATERLTLRPWTEQDLDDLYAYASVDGVGQMAGWAPHGSKEESRAILDLFLCGRRTFALEYEGHVIGSIGIEPYEESDHPELAHLRGRELGYVLAKPFWGQGLMPEAVQAVIRWLFQAADLDFLLVRHFIRNAQSRRVIEKCGFHDIGQTDFETCLGTVEPSLTYILYRQDAMKA